MGNLFCSECCTKDASGGYAAVSSSATGEEVFHVDPGNTNAGFTAMIAREFDTNATIFSGTFVDQKFTSKTTYEPRFVWVNLDTLTIHMSMHNTKERRHKEASLADVTNVERGAPKQLRSMADVPNGNACMAVNFQRGGGIDLKFSSAAECDLWMKVLTKIVNYLKKQDRM
jgi:hypothetical protein